MDPQLNPPVIPFILRLELALMPPGTYGISYDIYTRRTEDDLPYGWHAHRSSTYQEIKKVLQPLGYQRLQGSDWYCEPTIAIDAYWAMLGLKYIRPPGKFASTVKGLKTHHIISWILEVTNDIRLGGLYSAVLEGPTPRELVPAGVPSIAPQAPPALPRFTQPSEEAADEENWREHPAA